jgi:ferrous iron transport protein A
LLAETDKIVIKNAPGGRAELSVTGQASSAAAGAGVPLGGARKGFRGRVEAIDTTGLDCGLTPAEVERRLIEIGFVEGARVEILHEGAFGRDPIAVRINDATIALRRREAMAVLVRAADERS